MYRLSLYNDEIDSPAYSEFAVENLLPTTTMHNSRYDKTAE
jgi:hypothetical protein